MFADFDINQNGCLYLVRISFDGYGCCDAGAEISALEDEESSQLAQSIKSGNVETPEVEKILKNYLRKNKDALWEDALRHHELI